MKQILRIFILMGLVLVGVQVEGLGREIDDGIYGDPPLKKLIKNDSTSQKAKKMVEAIDSLIQFTIQPYDTAALSSLSYPPDFYLKKTKTTYQNPNRLTDIEKSTVEIDTVNAVNVESDLLELSKKIKGLFKQIDTLKTDTVLNPNGIFRPFIDTKDGQFIYNSSDEYRGKFPMLGSKYTPQFKMVLDTAMVNPNVPIFIDYTFFNPLYIDKYMSEKYAWVIYLEELNWLIGVAIPKKVFYEFATNRNGILNQKLKSRDTLINEITLKNEELKESKEKEQKDKIKIQKQLFLISALFVLLMLAFFKLIKDKINLKKKNEELEIEKEKTKAADKEKDKVIAEKEKIIVQKNMYLTAADLASSYIAMFDEKNKLVWSNKKFKEVYGDNCPSNFYDFTSYHDKDEMKEKIKNMRRRKDKEDISFQYPSTLNNRRVKSVISLFPKEKKYEKQRNWFVLVDTDVEKEYRAKETQKNIFQAISHDIISPLLACKSVLESLVRTHSIENKKVLEDLSKTLQSINESYSIVSNFKHTTKYEMGIIEFSADEIFLYEIVDDAMSIMSPFDYVNKTDVINKISEDITILGHEEMLISVFRNLISNSIKSIIKRRRKDDTVEGKIKIWAEKNSNDMVTICIGDNGIGMEQAEAKELFSKSIDKGLGTYLTKKFLLEHNPELIISVDSEINKGTKVCFNLKTK